MNTKNHARKLRDALNAVTGLNITHSQALEVSARLQGYRHLHKLQQQESEVSTPSFPRALTSAERDMLAELARQDVTPVYDFESPFSPNRVPTHHVDVPGRGVAHRDGGAGVYVVLPSRATQCSDCGRPIAEGELCTRSADKKATTAGIRYTHCRSCVPLTVTPRDPEAIRRERHVELLTYISFRSRENAVMFFNEIQALLTIDHPLAFQTELDGDRLAQSLGIALYDPPIERSISTG